MIYIQKNKIVKFKEIIVTLLKEITTINVTNHGFNTINGKINDYKIRFYWGVLLFGVSALI